MEYHEATGIAKKNPGAVVTRDASGTFIVRFTSGVVISSSSNDVDSDGVSHRESDERLGYIFREDQLLHEIANLNEAISELKNSVSAKVLFTHQLSQQLETLRAENVLLQKKLSRVSSAEWERIKEADRLERETDVARRKEVRRTVKCSCLGLVENCSRCFGTGEYTVDGFGNRV
jgi:hypothetical protein